MKIRVDFALVLLLVGALTNGRPSAHVSAQEPIDPWWLQPQRLIQTNLREIDATMDIDRYVRDIQESGANIVLFNVGGIVANYPTQLKYHHRNTFMEGDLVGTVLERLHAEGIRMIGRFDFSKINERFAVQRPEWLYVSESGEHVNYNGQVHTCVSGGYQQEVMFEILGEAIERYPLDGVFFNMIGYRRNDYSGNHHGICQCQNCKTRFRKYSGMELPSTQTDSPVYRKYLEFTNWMKDRQFNRVNAFLKGKRPDLAICTYTSSGVDVIRKESNHALGQGTYHDTDRAKWTMLTCGERQLANAAVHFIAIPYRHTAVSPYLTTRRLWQQMVNGAWLDFYCIGPLQRQEDRTGLDLLGGLYRFHAANQALLQGTVPAGEVGLLRRGDAEYEGIQQILAENQVAYELAELDLPSLSRYPLVIAPAAGGLSEDDQRTLDAYVRAGGKLLTTGSLPTACECLGETKFLESREIRQGGYIRIRPEDKQRLPMPLLDRLDLVFLKGTFHVVQPDPDSETLLRLIPPDMFGPPEKCYYRHVSDHAALLRHTYGDGVAAAFTFDIGTHYLQQAHQGHAALLLGALDGVLGLDRRVRLPECSPLVEINHRADPAGEFEWLSLYNHSGQRGVALHAALPISEVAIDLAPKGPVQSVRSLVREQPLPFAARPDGRIRITLPALGQYDIVAIDYKSAE